MENKQYQCLAWTVSSQYYYHVYLAHALIKHYLITGKSMHVLKKEIPSHCRCNKSMNVQKGRDCYPITPPMLLPACNLEIDILILQNWLTKHAIAVEYGHDFIVSAQVTIGLTVFMRCHSEISLGTGKMQQKEQFVNIVRLFLLQPKNEATYLADHLITTTIDETF